jgi:hypothetical protein
MKSSGPRLNEARTVALRRLVYPTALYRWRDSCALRREMSRATRNVRARCVVCAVRCVFALRWLLEVQTSRASHLIGVNVI